ncbi:uncharacterized protein LOC115212110 [Octopus sinensis]|uniref:Uncharacterized protein LOC115212110 n=1 Tax=Octopus sinensis TaxID=2607531 RepID=A0A6P7SFS9_9MOLL|nr:uncharacterized protein LOC115212110 [Octopus sinensis]
MYSDVGSKVRVGLENSDEFNIQVRIHQGSVLIPLLFIRVLQAITDKFKTGYPWKLLYADDLALIANSEAELEKKFQVWKQNPEPKIFNVNLAKTKVVSARRDNSLIPADKWPCSICRKGMGCNSICCTKYV